MSGRGLMTCPTFGGAVRWILAAFGNHCQEERTAPIEFCEVQITVILLAGFAGILDVFSTVARIVSTEDNG